MILPVNLDAEQVNAIERAGEELMRRGEYDDAVQCLSVVNQYRRVAERLGGGDAVADNVVRLHDYGLKVGA